PGGAAAFVAGADLPAVDCLRHYCRRCEGLMPRLGLALLLVLLPGCRGFATRAEMTPPPQVASSARVTEAGVQKVVIDRDCSKLGDPSDEYVCVTNQGPVPADMSSWVVRNVLGRSFSFPPGFMLAPGQTVRVHT